MRKLSFPFLGLALLFGANSFAQNNTPGTGVHWNMDSLAVNFPATVTQTGTHFVVNDVIGFTAGDTFFIDQPVEVTFASTATFEFNGAVVNINPANGMASFEAVDSTLGFLRIKINDPVVVQVNNLNINYSLGLSVLDGNVSFNNVHFNRTLHKSPNPSGALSVINGYIRVDSSSFTESGRSAITVGANGNGGVHVFNSDFIHNDNSNGNYPQINIGTANDSGVVIQNCYIEGLYPRAGAIAFLNISGAAYQINVDNNIIKNNRYGVAVQGGNIHGYITRNEIDSNNIEGQPNLGGSGLNFIGNNTINIIASGNSISNNLWGVTVQPSNGMAPVVSLGKVNATDPVDTGANRFTTNGNGGVNYAIYDNTPDTVWAQLNFWDYEDIDSVETTIFHHPDDSTLGWVIYDPLGTIDTTGTNDTDSTVGIHHVIVAQHFAQVYPNPVSANNRILNIDAEDRVTSIRMYNLEGRLVYSNDHVYQNKMEINLNQLPAGVYSLTLVSDQKIQQQKIILE